ncbi:MAG TPA: hypothetical protein VLK33_05125 [Terriglobales bacterium]|nr:hypothetical protein [Terriglobales bacterium]
MKVIAYTGGRNSPARVPRVQQYISPLRALNIDLIESPAYSGVYPPEAKWKRPIWGLCNLAEHALTLFNRIDMTSRCFNGRC